MLLGDVAKYIVVSARGILPSGHPILCIVSKQALANSNAFGLASPISSEAEMTSLLAMNFGSSPAAIMRANQYIAASGSLPLKLFWNAEAQS